MTEGNWRLGMFVDEDATDEQLEKLTAVFGGQMGGPMAGFAPLIGEVLGVERAPIEVVEEGLRHSVRIGMRSTSRSKTSSVRHRDRGAGPPVGVFHPVGSELTAAEATRSEISAFGIEYEGKSGLSAPFSWAA